MTILAIETATERLGAALLTSDGRLYERHADSRSSHCELLAGFIAALSEESGTPLVRIEGIAVSIGPGSFTGLRIGIATAMGLAYGLGVPACGVGTLAALSWEAAPEGMLVCPLMDAGRGEVYAAVYRMAAGVPETIVEPAALPLPALAEKIMGLGDPVTIVGPGTERFGPMLDATGAPILRTAPGRESKPSAASVARIGLSILASGGGVSPAALAPVYLRRSDAELAKPKPSPFA